MKKIFCRHKSNDYQVIYRNQGVTKNLKYIEDYEIRVCLNCKKRYRVAGSFEWNLDENNSLAHLEGK